jgi:AraC-like DNA-binding protein
METPLHLEVGRFERVSRDPGTFDMWMHAAYVDYRRLSSGDPQGCSFSFAGVDVAGLSIATVRHGMELAAQTETLTDAVLIATTLAGRATVSAGDVRLEPEVGLPHLLPVGRPWVVTAEPFTSAVVRIPTTTLDAAAAGMGWEGDDVRFTGCLPRAGLGPYLAGTIAHVRDDVLDAVDAPGPLILGEAARALAAAVLIAIPNTATTDLAEATRLPPGSAEPATVRRAMEFIESHAHEDIRIDQIAEAARIGARGLQAAFRRHRDETPLEHLRQVRMAGAHRDLRAGDATRGDTVAAIAAHWGFTHPGRFSVEYRRIHGASPSHTLRT